jgi:hypothetical protein
MKLFKLFFTRTFHLKSFLNRTSHACLKLFTAAKSILKLYFTFKKLFELYPLSTLCTHSPRFERAHKHLRHTGGIQITVADLDPHNDITGISCRVWSRRSYFSRTEERRCGRDTNCIVPWADCLQQSCAC